MKKLLTSENSINSVSALSHCAINDIDMQSLVSLASVVIETDSNNLKREIDYYEHANRTLTDIALSEGTSETVKAEVIAEIGRNNNRVSEASIYNKRIISVLWAIGLVVLAGSSFTMLSAV